MNMESGSLEKATRSDASPPGVGNASIGSRLAAILSRYKEASIAVVAVLLVIYFQIGSNGGFLTTQLMSVVLRDTGRLGD